MYRSVAESQTLLINTQSRKLEAENKSVIKFGFGQSPFFPPQFVMDALKEAVHHKEYTSVQGDYELRKLIADFHRQHNGIITDPDNILIAPGSKSLLYSILMSFEKADVFIASPSWVSYEPQARLAGHTTIRLKTSFEDRWRITPEMLVEASKEKKNEVSILILNYPGNPDGLSYTEEELTSLAGTAKALDILVIADEIYGLLNHSNTHKSFVQYYPEKTITTTGLSKWCGAGGWRLGVALLYDSIAPAFKKTLIGIGSETYSCAPAPVQMAARAAYGNFQLSMEYVNAQNKYLSMIGNYCATVLNENDIQTHTPEGGFYLFPDFSRFKKKLSDRGIFTSFQLCEKLLEETGVALLPAAAFGFEKEYLAARLAYVDFDDPLIEHSTGTVEELFPRVVKGIAAIVQWFSKM
ncbi:aminotransferase class I/II-fold pyridoxal phosphate-dependent enzyme [Aquimarina sp. TRL1]|uniref:pyridoxal phosphate-dependent aminotransferase n=1 Tax=Aquimarina sp. (strain TRL1) TaxID=2736252 RepID=UPI00158D5198|nr:aminotransferase class I/II-fold pyridoxal phosphate-dependent enzyme [Aquimarina sp. TRL1]QKX06618.1 aminotransferase class I/II-fold pyridoxal phosphate-dependent enzyme [Aquimarina sp. TRL1]